MKKTKLNTIDKILIFCTSLLLIFTITMIVIFCIYQNTPDVLIGAVFTALFGELGFCTLIYRVKYKIKGDE